MSASSKENKVSKSNLVEKLQVLSALHKYIPEVAMIFYRGINTKNGMSHLEKINYIESAEIIRKNGAYTLGVTKPATFDFIRELNNQIDVSTNGMNLKFKGIIPSNVLYFDRREEGFRIMWRCPGGPKKMLFTSMNIKDGTYIMPDLIFDYDDDNCSVYAAIGNNLYHAPSFNIDSDGALCFGNVTEINKSVRYVETFIEKSEQMFFGSKFSHCANDQCLKEPIIPFYQKVLPTFKDKKQWEPYMVPLKKTIDKLI